MIRFITALVALASLAAPLAASADEPLVLARLDDGTVRLTRESSDRVAIFVSADTRLDRSDTLIAETFAGRELALPLSVERPGYVLLRSANGGVEVVGERALPLEKASNFRDMGGYRTKDGRTVRWGKLYRSANFPHLTDHDVAYLRAIGFDSLLDLRALPERELVPDTLDNRLGILFLSDDYTLADLMGHMGTEFGENIYKGMDVLLVPHMRMLVERLRAGRGAVVFHDVWGQDRAGVMAALVYEVLGVDRATIIEDFHLSESLRRTRFELPDLRPEDHPGNPIVAYYAGKRKERGFEPEKLYTPGGASYIEQFLDYIDATYGGSEGYFRQALGYDEADIAALREVMLR